MTSFLVICFIAGLLTLLVSLWRKPWSSGPRKSSSSGRAAWRSAAIIGGALGILGCMVIVNLELLGYRTYIAQGLKRIFLIVSLGFLLSLNSCPRDVAEQNPQVETVMSPGMEIWATTAKGRIGIRAGEGFERTYFWDEDCQGTVTLWPRKERWKGSLGIYYPGPGNTWWFSCSGVKRAVVQEGMQNFDSVEALVEWLERRRLLQPVYTDSGIVVGWIKTTARRELGVEVWQVLIQGKKPEELPGSRNDAISVQRGAH